MVVASLKAERICSTEFNVPRESLICLKAVSCNKSIALPRSKQYLVHIKTTNTKGEYQCIIMGHNDPVRVDRRKG